MKIIVTEELVGNVSKKTIEVDNLELIQVVVQAATMVETVKRAGPNALQTLAEKTGKVLGV